MSSQYFIRNYFNRFPSFSYDPSNQTMMQFYRLSRQKGWSDERHKIEKERLKSALVKQFNRSYGESETDIKAWQGLCRAIYPNPAPKTRAGCKKLLRRTHVNLVDLVDKLGTGQDVLTYSTEKELADYSMKTRKIFPREDANAGNLLKYLLRHIFTVEAN